MTPKRLELGDESYDSDQFGTAWWTERARNRAHRKAYRTIVEIAARHCPQARHIVDYACGPGLLLRELVERFPGSRITAIDESRAAIEAIPHVLGQRAWRAHGERIDRRQAVLPAFDLDLGRVDLICFLFPDFRGGITPRIVRHWKRHLATDWQACKAFRKQLQDTRRPEDFKANSAGEIFFKRLVMRNHRALLRKGALVIRVDYGQCSRDDTDRTMRREMEWIEGCRTAPKHFPKELRQRQRVFDLIDSSYHQSRGVMQDVYHQTGDPDDKNGGYLVSVLRAR